MSHHSNHWSAFAVIPASLLAIAHAAEPTNEHDFDAQFALAEKALKNNQPNEALKIFSNLEKKFVQSPAKFRALFLIQKANCYFQQKEWKCAASTLQEFLLKFPKGTEDLLGANDDKVITCRFTLAEVYRQLGQWGLALEVLSHLANNPLAPMKDRSTAYRMAANFVQEKVTNSRADEKAHAQQQAVEFLRRALSVGLNTPEGKVAGSALMELYIQLHRMPEAQALQTEIESCTTPSPTDKVLNNRLRLSQGDAYFAEANSTPGLTQKNTLLQNALKSYQAVQAPSVLLNQIKETTSALKASLTQLTNFSIKPAPSVIEKIAALQSELQECSNAEAALQLNANYQQTICYRIGLCFHELQMPYEAIIAFQEILNTDPLSPQAPTAAYYLILNQIEIGKLREAEAGCRSFIENYPEAKEISNVAILVGSLVQDRQDYRETIQQYQWVKSRLKKLKPEVIEEIDYRCCFANFSLNEWAKANEGLTLFIKKYPKSVALEQVTYLQALALFYQGHVEDAQKSLGDYQKKFPSGIFLPDVQYRLALIEYGKVPPQFDNALQICQDWLKRYAPLNKSDIKCKLADVYVLMGDSESGLAAEIDRQLVLLRQSTAAEFEGKSSQLEAQKTFHAQRSRDAYLRAAKNGQLNPEALNYSLSKLATLLKAEGNFSVLRDLYLELYGWNKHSPEAASYLFEAISAIERLNKQKPETSNQDQALLLLTKAIQESINDPRQDGVEKLLTFLASKVHLKHQSSPDGLTSAQAEIKALLATVQLPPPVARARLYFTLAQVSLVAQQARQANSYFRFIAEHFSAEELSAPLLALTAENIFANGERTTAELYYNYLIKNFRSSPHADYAFAGLAMLRLEQKKFPDALKLCDEALQQGFIKNKECVLMLTRSQALTELRRYTEAKKGFEAIAQNKAWRGESTACSLYWLGLIEERQNHTAEAVAYYRRCYQAWKCYPLWSAKAYWGTAQLLAKELHQPEEATALIHEMLSHDFLKATPEGQHAQNLLSAL